MKKVLLIAALSTAAASAQAWEPEVYLGGGPSFWLYKHENIGANFAITTVDGVAGLKLFEYLAVEAKAGLGLNQARDEDTITMYDEATGVVLSEDVYNNEAELEAFVSFYLKPMISNEKATLYGLLGYTMVDMEHYRQAADGSSSETVFDDTADDLSYGVGASWIMGTHTELTAEWKKLINADDFDFRGWSVGFTYTF